MASEPRTQIANMSASYNASAHLWERAVRKGSPVLICATCDRTWWPDQTEQQQGRALHMNAPDGRGSCATGDPAHKASEAVPPGYTVGGTV